MLIIYIGLFVKEPEIWVENQRQQKLQNREVRAPLFSIFKPEMLGNTLTTCLMMASAFVIYYANYALFATHLQLDLHLTPALVALPIALANTCFFLSSLFWGWLAERIGRRWAIIIPAALGVPTRPYLLTQDYTLTVTGFALQGLFASAACTFNIRPISPNGFRPKRAPPRSPSATTRGRSGAG